MLSLRIDPDEIMAMDDDGLMDLQDDPLPGEQRKLVLIYE